MSDIERNERDVNRRTAAPNPARDASASETSSDAIDSTPRSGRAHNADARRGSRGKHILKWAAFIIGLFFFLAVLREAVDPFGDDPYVGISHGDHTHYVPEDRDPNVSISRFPTTEPAPDERITPDGRIVKKE